MTKKQKKALKRIIIVLICFAILVPLDKTGVLSPFPWYAVAVLFLVPYLIIGYDVIIKSAKNIKNGQVFDENFLMMIATFAAFGMQEYSEALAVMLFYQVGELFESYAVGKSRKSISDMMSIAPEYANLEKDGDVEEVDPEDVKVGDIIVIRPGERIPLDGTVLSGESFLDTAALTGESVPRRAAVGDAVISGCLNGEGTLRVKVQKAYEDSTVARILDLVENASNKKARLENFITRFAKYYTPVVTIGAAVLALIPPLLFGGGWADWIGRACVFLIVSCPCALVISVPLGFFAGIGASSKIGVLVKGSNYLEALGKVRVIVFDKTGTLTKGEFEVSKVNASEGISGNQLLELAAYGEANSTHPIAQSVLRAYEKRLNESLDRSRLSEVQEIAGHGIRALLDGKVLLVGNEKLLSREGVDINCGHDNISPDSTKGDTATSVNDNQGGTRVLVSYDGAYQGSILISDTMKNGVSEAMSGMKRAGVRETVMLTGDRKESAEYISQASGVDRYFAELLPQDKVAKVEKLLSQDTVAFVGDGINDAPVLMRADVGIAMGSLGSDAAIEAADIVLMDDDIRKIPAVISIAKRTLRIVKENIVFALTVKILILVLGALGLAGMWAAVFADVGVAVIAILNSMRALNYTGADIYP